MQTPDGTGHLECHSVTLGPLFGQHDYAYNSVPDPGTQKVATGKLTFLFKSASGRTNQLSARKKVFQVGDREIGRPGDDCRHCKSYCQSR